jgi:predicted membrane protein (TIGR00267 family)
MRRYIFRGLIDGSLSTLGVVIGAQSADVGIIIAAGIGGGVANGLSNILGAFTAEKTETEMKIMKIQKAMVVGPELRKTEFYRDLQKATILSGIFDGVATIVGSVIPIVPFVVSLFVEIEKTVALISSIVLTMLLLFLIGGYLGKVSRTNVIISGIKMAIAGLVTAFVCTLIEHSLIP